MKPLYFDSDLQLLKNLIRDFRKLGYRRRQGKGQIWHYQLCLFERESISNFALIYTPLLRDVHGVFLLSMNARCNKYDEIKEILDFWLGEDLRSSA